ncbi:conserved hypothetical protein, partial [delta proteobacterium NaphS2]
MTDRPIRYIYDTKTQLTKDKQMKTTALLLLILLMVPVVSNAEDFLGAPI